MATVSEDFNSRLLSAISALQAAFIEFTGDSVFFQRLLKEALALSGCASGILLAIPEGTDPKQVKLADLPVLAIANEPPLPVIHTALERESPDINILCEDFHLEPDGNIFWIPLRWEDELIALMLLANQPSVSREIDCRTLQPFLNTCAQLTRAQWQREENLALKNRLKSLSGLHELILKSAGEGIYGMDANKRIIFANPYTEELLGYNPGELLGRDSHAVFHHSHGDGTPYAKTVCPIYESVEKGENVRITGEVFWRKDGSCFPVEYTSTPIWENGRPMGAVILFRDITAELNVEEQLRENNELFKLAFTHSQIGKMLMSPEGRFMMVNKAFCDLIGYSENELLTMHYRDITYPDDIAASEAFGARIRNGEIDKLLFEKRYLHKKGHVLNLLLSIAAVRDAQGKQLYNVAYILDAGTQQGLVSLIQEKDKLFRAAFHNAPIGKTVTSMAGQILEVNQVFCEIMGYSEKELLQRSFKEITHPDDLDENLDYLERTEREQLQRVQFEKRYIHKLGHFIRAQVDVSIIRDEDGKPTYYVAQIQDITERKRMEEALRESEARFRSAFDYAPIGMALVSPDGRWLKVNRAVCQLTGYSEEELLRSTFQSITHPDDLAVDLMFVGKLLRGEIETYQMEKRYIHKDGHTVWIQLNASAVQNEAGEFSYAISQIQDITERKTSEEKLRKAKEEAETAAAAKAEFLATMSHEIRTPMNAVLGMTTLLGETKLNDEQRQLVDTIRSGSSTLLSTINDILDFSKIESGKMEFDNQPFELKACIEESFALFIQKAQEKGLGLYCYIQPEVPLIIQGDSNRLRQILVNLIGNAIKFTDSGDIRVTVERLSPPDDDDTLELQFNVQDTGCGIPEDKLQMIFDSFTQVAPAISRKYGGTGLGLAICNRMVQMMGGRIWVESQLDEGSTFRFSIRTHSVPWVPLQLPGTLRPVEEPVFARQYPMNLLVAEDNATNQKLIMHILRRLGYQPTLVENGIAVLEALQKNAFDLILMDIQMPEMDGLEASRQIIQRYGVDTRPVVVAMTAFSMVDEREQYLAAGMDDYISKPISADDIRGVLCKWYYKWHESSFRNQSLDAPALMSRVGYNMAALRELVILFREDCPRLIAEIRHGLDHSNLPGAARAAHELKGACLALGAVGMLALVRDIETKIRQQEPQALPQSVDELEQEFRAVETALETLLKASANL